MKLIEKKKINSRYYKRYDAPKAPYRRMLESKHMSQMVKKQLQAQHQALNPFELKRAIEKKLKTIFDQIKLAPKVRHRL